MVDLLIFTEKVVNLKAWQLYLGNGIWTLAIGIVLIIISKLLGLFGLNNDTTNKLLSMTAKVATGGNQHKQYRQWRRRPTDLSEGFLTAPPLTNQPKLLGGCAGTRYGCCPDGVKAKRDALGSNCRSKHPSIPQGNGSCRRWNPLMSDCAQQQQPQQQQANCYNDNQQTQGDCNTQQAQGDCNTQQAQGDCYTQQAQGDCYNQQQSQGDVCYNQGNVQCV